VNLAMIYSSLMDVGAPITSILPNSDYSNGGLFVDNKYLVQLSKISSQPIILSVVENNGELFDAGSFDSIDTLIQYIMEN